MQLNRKVCTADELHKLIMRRKLTYDQIRRLDPSRFSDLESTMRMLYDHGNMSAAEEGDTVSEHFSEPEKSEQIVPEIKSVKKPEVPSPLVGSKRARESTSIVKK